MLMTLHSSSISWTGLLACKEKTTPLIPLLFAAEPGKIIPYLDSEAPKQNNFTEAITAVTRICFHHPCILLNHRIIGWKSPLRSSSPTIHPTPPCLLKALLRPQLWHRTNSHPSKAATSWKLGRGCAGTCSKGLCHARDQQAVFRFPYPCCLRIAQSVQLNLRSKWKTRKQLCPKRPRTSGPVQKHQLAQSYPRTLPLQQSHAKNGATRQQDADGSSHPASLCFPATLPPFHATYQTLLH